MNGYGRRSAWLLVLDDDDDDDDSITFLTRLLLDGFFFLVGSRVGLSVGTVDVAIVIVDEVVTNTMTITPALLAAALKALLNVDDWTAAVSVLVAAAAALDDDV